MTIAAQSTAGPAAPAARSGPRHKTAILAVILISFMILLDNSIIFTALPRRR